ncbi:DsbA-like thioredoxin domain protein [hydrothermal vent metagenome]|uniref:DsbA-like thioredoxin domain protein n=1 Tax=hydrothermal vent metagenome TaxID=652676 RepID=A0A3B0YZ13_9ZZZZ
MSSEEKFKVLYFSDILCVWAYLAQVRLDRLVQTFDSKIIIEEHFISIFGSVKPKMEQHWSDGGVSDYAKHVRSIGSRFDHIDIHPDIWVKNTPVSSGGCHLFLKAIQILDARDELGASSLSTTSNKSIFERVVWEFRLAFFRDLVDISHFRFQVEISEKLGLPINKIQQLIDSGEAFSALDTDLQLKEQYGVVGSPSLVLNEGRQIIYGNVGYRVIEANIQELINQPENQASWC